MTTQEIISKIIKLEYEITTRIIRDRNFKATEDDEYKEHRKELKKLRKKIKNVITSKSIRY